MTFNCWLAELGWARRTVERICFLRGLADARITLLPRN